MASFCFPFQRKITSSVPSRIPFQNNQRIISAAIDCTISGVPSVFDPPNILSLIFFERVFSTYSVWSTVWRNILSLYLCWSCSYPTCCQELCQEGPSLEGSSGHWRRGEHRYTYVVSIERTTHMRSRGVVEVKTFLIKPYYVAHRKDSMYNLRQNLLGTKLRY